MRVRRVGRSGFQVSSLTLSTLGWGQALDEHETQALTEAYVEAGGSTFATSSTDGQGAAEDALGGLLGGVLSRDSVTLIARSGAPDHPVDASRGGMLSSLDATLGRLRTDHVDLWLAPGWSELVPLAETLSALEHAYTSGRARYVGIADVDGWQLARAFTLLEAARVPLVASAREYSLLRRDIERSVAPAADHLGVGLIAGAPLARGVLAGRYRHTVPADSRGASSPAMLDGYLDNPARAVVEACCAAADGLGSTAADVALRWVLDRRSVATAVVGVRTTGQLRAVLQSIEQDLPTQVRDALNDVSARRS